MATRISDVMWKQFFEKFAADGTSLQAQIRQMMVSAILDRMLPINTPIVSSRKLATELGVGRNTVVLAYQQLSDEGYIVARERSGYYVNPDVLEGHLGAEKSVEQDEPVLQDQFVNWEQRLKISPSTQRSIVKEENWQKYPYPFLYGQFDADLFPTANWRECCMKLLSVMEIRDWAPDLISGDDSSLIEQIRERVLPRRGVWAEPDEILITVGAQQALYLLAEVLVSKDTVFGVEDPGYPDIRNIVTQRTPHKIPLPVDMNGLMLSEDVTKCDYIFVTPSHQCPTTVTMPLERRKKLLQMASQNDFVIIEDDYESQNSFYEMPNPALKSMDKEGRVIYIGSLSKSLAPGLRLGFIVAPKRLIREVRALRRLMVRHPAIFIQRTFSLFLSLGYFDSLQRKHNQVFKERAEVMTRALKEHMPDMTFHAIMGGASCWVRGPDWLKSQELADLAEKTGVLIEPGDIFFMATNIKSNYFRLGFSSIPQNKIEPGIKKLAEILNEMKQARAL
ncbi:PLP-dependent aminotransferase family protein [Terasakiella sp.]|uniref:MocR-like pyridoxine biosynthesis transcription factor PdxR n=1 Tax=Terasakiella sp. TaxID=2034861 RepID=UPI003AA917FC